MKRLAVSRGMSSTVLLMFSLEISAPTLLTGCNSRSSNFKFFTLVMRTHRTSALGGTRTPNPLIRSQMLYPLSYERWCASRYRLP